ncbi:MAG: hypothetical protein A3G43_09730 [Ignavibacteria bacterium RIFCSPLOWO2_12_FULL_56_21]|nr:MAG: hypothetical protein A3G43_09730 [Ignavibacteria bacterium RIFCSPLOWO2_12_FULL_56_21]
MIKMTNEELTERRKSRGRFADMDRLPVCAVLDNIRSLYNVGSIFRTADAVFIRELILTGYTPKPPRKEIDKTALGATSTVPWRYFRSPLEGLKTLKSEGYLLCGLEVTHGSVPLHSWKLPTGPLALVAGNEVVGVSADVLRMCEHVLEIPMYGSKDSLNVAVAVGIALYELSRRFRSQNAQH